MAATGKVIGTVTAVVGEAKATAADGTVRILQVGDQVRSDEAISTSAAGSINVALESGKTLDCGGDVSLTLHESILGVATAASASTEAPASDVDAIQRAIAAGQDPSQVAAATAAGGAPAAGGADDGGAHEPVILEQSNTASVVTAGFTTEGDTIAIAALQVESLPAEAVAAVSALLGLSTEIETSSITAAAEFDSVFVAQINTVADDQPIAPVNVIEPGQTAPVATIVIAPDQPVETNNAPQVIVANEPVIVATTPEVNEEVAESPQPPVVADEPVIVASDPDANDEVSESPQPPVVVTQPEDETVVVTEPENDTVVVTEPEDTSDLPDSTSSSSALLTYSISANTNQDEQLALVTFENDGNTFQSLVFFHQQGQQKPMAVPLEFELDYGAESTIKLEYIDAFAGDSDSSTGHTAQKIAIKNFALGEGDTNTLLAQESDGVNIGLVGRTTQLEGTVTVDMQDPNDAADESSPASDWTFTNPEDVHERYTYDGGSIPQADADGFDILDVTVSALDLGALGTNDFEVIALKGSEQQTLALSVEDVLNVTGGENVLHIIGGKEQAKGETVSDTLNLVGGGWTVVDGDSSTAGIQPSYFGWVQVTHNTGATLLVDPDVNVLLLG